MNTSLLPFNASQLEKNLEAVLARTNNIPVLINTLWDPVQCPENLLPWLAWTLSVDTWDSEWSDITKRNLIANSVQIHRTKGTVSAIERVLGVLGVDAELTEWFEYGGEPHTFRVTAWANANLDPDADVILSALLYRSLKNAIDNVKPARSHYDFRVGAAFGGELGLACSSTTTSMTRVIAEPELIIGFNTTAVAPSIHVSGTSVIRIIMETP
jgi:phage tail P2-like protein